MTPPPHTRYLTYLLLYVLIHLGVSPSVDSVRCIFYFYSLWRGCFSHENILTEGRQIRTIQNVHRNILSFVKMVGQAQAVTVSLEELKNGNVPPERATKSPPRQPPPGR